MCRCFRFTDKLGEFSGEREDLGFVGQIKELSFEGDAYLTRIMDHN